MTDQVGVRFGIAAGLLFALTGLVVAGGLPGAYGVGVLTVGPLDLLRLAAFVVAAAAARGRGGTP